jgi:diketogulonate reductase-like aldo/keto reductase
VASSLANLATPDEPAAYLDSLVMHSPYESAADTLAAWKALQAYVPTRIRALGISHATVPVLENLVAACGSASPPLVPPAAVQNRFCARERAWDVAVRAFCRRSQADDSAMSPIAFQAFWTLTGNPDEWRRAAYVQAVADGAGTSRAGAWYALITALDMVVLNGTTDSAHMKEDLEALGKVAAWRETEHGRTVWEDALQTFQRRIGDL